MDICEKVMGVALAAKRCLCRFWRVCLAVGILFAVLAGIFLWMAPDKYQAVAWVELADTPPTFYQAKYTYSFSSALEAMREAPVWTEDVPMPEDAILQDICWNTTIRGREVIRVTTSDSRETHDLLDKLVQAYLWARTEYYQTLQAMAREQWRGEHNARVTAERDEADVEIALLAGERERIILAEWAKISLYESLAVQVDRTPVTIVFGAKNRLFGTFFAFIFGVLAGLIGVTRKPSTPCE